MMKLWKTQSINLKRLGEYSDNLLSEVTPTDIEALLNAELSFSESPKYSILNSSLSNDFKILVYLG